MAAESFAYILIVIHILSAIINWHEAERGGTTKYEPPAMKRMAAILSISIAFCIWFYFT